MVDLLEVEENDFVEGLVDEEVGDDLLSQVEELENLSLELLLPFQTGVENPRAGLLLGLILQFVDLVLHLSV